MNQYEYQREMCAYDEKIALAKIEESKASQRVRELEYEKARFQLNISVQQCKEQPQSPQGGQQG